MKPTPLSQLATVSAGQAAPKDDEFSDHGIPFVRAGSLDSLLSGKTESDLELVSDETAKLRKLKTYPKGTILFAKSGMSATKDRIYVLQNPAYVVSHLATLISNGKTHTDYLRLALKHFPPSVLIKDPAYPAISLGDIQSYEIPVPDDLDDQIRIAHLLGKVEGMIAQRKQHLRQLDDLLKSVFLEMFGDPVRNEKGWEEREVKSFSQSRLGKMRDKKFISGNHLRKYIGNSNVQWFRFVFDDLLEMDFDERERAIFSLQYGDLLVCEGGDIGRCAIWKNQIEDCYFQKALHRVRLNSTLALPEYIQFVFLFFSMFNGFKITSKATIAHLTGEKLAATKVPLPPVKLQNQFGTIVEKVEGLKFRYQQSLTDLETLYGALSQQAFKGELDLSRVPVPGIQPEEEKAVAVEPLHIHPEQSPAINLPDTDNLLAALESAEVREGVITQWLEAYRGQLGSTPFSVQHFMAAAQTRLAELHPDNDFALGANDYEHIKAWVFQALASGTLTQAFDDAGNRIELKAVQA